MNLRTCNRCNKTGEPLEIFYEKNSKVCLDCLKELIEKGLKWCSKCKEDKPIDTFPVTEYYNSICNICKLINYKRIPIKECKKLLLKYLIKENN